MRAQNVVSELSHLDFIKPVELIAKTFHFVSSNIIHFKSQRDSNTRSWKFKSFDHLAEPPCPVVFNQECFVSSLEPIKSEFLQSGSVGGQADLGASSQLRQKRTSMDLKKNLSERLKKQLSTQDKKRRSDLLPRQHSP